jgi:hypothetical protein
MGTTGVEVFVDPSCPWAWITSRWIAEVAPERDLSLTWRSYCLEIRDDYGVAPTMPEEYRERALAGHALSHRMLRIFEAARAESGEGAVEALYTEWGRRFFLSDGGGRGAGDALLAGCLSGSGLSADLLGAADDEKWDAADRRGDGGGLPVRRAQDPNPHDRRAGGDAVRLQGTGHGPGPAR